MYVVIISNIELMYDVCVPKNNYISKKIHLSESSNNYKKM